jgi:Flp pilus assembly protein TadG
MSASVVMSARSDRGMATAELAVGLPVLALLVIFGAGVIGAARTDVECQNAARIAARLAARGESLDAVRRAAAQAAPPGAEVSVSGGQTVVVVVSREVGIPGPWSGQGPHVRVQGKAVADLEPSA